MAGIEPYIPESRDYFASSGSNQTGMRERNERLVLTILRRQGALPKAEIARQTGLSAQTVSVIMRALENDGLLEKGEKLRGKVGQPSVPMRLAADGAYFLGLKVGRRTAELALVDFAGTERATASKSYAYPDPDATLQFVKTALEQVCRDLTPEQRRRVAGLGIASPFFLWEWAENIGIDPDRMTAWKDYDLVSKISEIVDFPVYLGNDATSACGAELVFGTQETPPEFLYLYVGYFIGGGIVLNGALYPGRTGNAGAVGTFPIGTAPGSQTQLVDVASLIGLEKRLTARLGHASDIIDPQTDWTIPEPILRDWLGEAAPSLAQMIVGALSIIDFPTILIDGNMPEGLRNRLVGDVRTVIETLPWPGLIVPEILPGSLGPRARALGAAALPLSKRFLLET